MIKISNINKVYNKNKSNEVKVLNGITLEFPDTSLVTILGKSGSGKSTLLNVIGGLDKANGEINYNDELICNKYNPNLIDTYRNNNIGYIFQNYHLIPELTVYENLAYSLELIGITNKQDVESRINNALDLVNMQNYKRRNALALSGGQQQRVAIARAIIKGAKILIADEPTGNLDSKNTIDVMNILKSISKSCLVLLVTHNKEVAYSYSDRIISLEDGSVISDEVYDNNTLQSFDNSIYLSELNKQEVTANNTTINVYSNNEKSNINIYIKDNVVYLDVLDMQTKVIGLNSNIEIKEKRIDNKEIEFIDTSIFNKEEDYKINYFKYFFEKSVNSFKNFFRTTRKQKFMHLLFLLIGILISYNLASLSSNINYDKDSLLSSYNYETVFIENNKEVYSQFYTNELYNDVFIQPVSSRNALTTYITLSVLYNQDITYVSSSVIACTRSYSHINYDIDTLKDDEIILTKYVALEFIEEISHYKQITQKDLINTQIKFNDKYFTIVAVDNDLECNSIITTYNTLMSYYDYSFNYIYNNNDYYYTKDDEVYASSNSIIFNTKEEYVEFFSNASTNYLRTTPIHIDYTLVSGNYPKYNEVVIPEYLKGTTFEENFVNTIYTVVGYYDLQPGQYPVAISSLQCFLASALPLYTRGDLSYLTEDMDLLLDNVNESVYFKDYVLNYYFYYNYNSNIASIVTISIMIIIVVLILFFTAQAKMISKINNIGIFRSLGSSKKKIYFSFLSDTLVNVTFTTVVGYIAVYLVILFLAGNITSLVVYVINLKYFFFGLFGLYSLMLIASLLPVFCLLRKTPIEITTKYDI